MGQQILLVEDNPIEACEISHFVREAGFQVEVAVDAERGLERLEAAPFDLLLCDLHLPGENGLALCRRLKRRDSFRHLKVVLLTRYSDPLNFLRGLEAGADGFISKDQDPATIVARLKRVLLRNGSAEATSRDANTRVMFLDADFELNVGCNQLLEVLLSGLEDVVYLNNKYEVEVRARVEAQQSRDEINARLKALNATLEQRVAQRTRELEQSIDCLRRKNAELDQFVYIASHDLQEPLRKLMSFSQLLEYDIGGQINDQVQRDLFFVKDGAKRMQQLVQDLLALCRTGQSTMQHEAVAVDACVDRALDALAARIEETGAEIVRDPLPEVMADRTLLTQLYQNLISNALKFIQQDRPTVRLTAEIGPDIVTLGVQDNGIGVAPEFQKQIFAPFQRLHGRDEFEGTGIGLTICQKAVERLGGTIWVDSALGSGAHFKFTLPLQDRAPACPCASDPALEAVSASATFRGQETCHWVT